LSTYVGAATAVEAAAAASVSELVESDDGVGRCVVTGPVAFSFLGEGGLLGRVEELFHPAACCEGRVTVVVVVVLLRALAFCDCKATLTRFGRVAPESWLNG
jgi:hypothetical protein